MKYGKLTCKCGAVVPKNSPNQVWCIGCQEGKKIYKPLLGRDLTEPDVSMRNKFLLMPLLK